MVTLVSVTKNGCVNCDCGFVLPMTLGGVLVLNLLNLNPLKAQGMVRLNRAQKCTKFAALSPKMRHPRERAHHRAIAEDNRSRLSRWQLSIRDSVAVGGGKEVSRWLHPPRRPVVFRSGESLITHPAEIVDHLRNGWEPIMTQELGKRRLSEEDMQLLLRGMPRREVVLPPLTGHMLRATAMRRHPSSPRISLQVEKCHSVRARHFLRT